MPPLAPGRVPPPSQDAPEAGTRRRIIDAVADVLAERGLAGLTVRAVGQRAGVSHAMVHYYFTGKDELLRALVGQTRGAWIHPLEDVVLGTGSALAKLEALISLLDRPGLRAAVAVQRQLLAQSGSDPELADLLGAERARWTGAFVELVRQLQLAGDLDAGSIPELFGTGLAAMCEGLLSAPVRPAAPGGGAPAPPARHGTGGKAVGSTAGSERGRVVGRAGGAGVGAVLQAVLDPALRRAPA
jgi:AcrR family transcriptional regulator